MKHLPRKKQLAVACVHAMALMFTHYSFSAETDITEVEVTEQTKKIDKKELAKKQKAETEHIEVVGYAGSIEKAINTKRYANGVVDAIIAEDIGKMADSNIAEAMQRMPGVSINRDGGEGTTVSVRGMAPSMNQISMNGQVIQASSDEGGVSFNTMSADMLSRIEVIKTPSASTVEGSLGGRVNLTTARPLDRKWTYFIMNQKFSYNELSEELDPSFSVNYIGHFLDKKLGIAFGSTIERRRSRQDYLQTYGWQNNYYSHDTSGLTYAEDASGTLFRLDETTSKIYDASGDIDVSEQVSLDDITATDQLGFLPNFYLSQYTDRDDTRKSINLTVQIKPQENLSAYADYMYTELDSRSVSSMLRHGYKPFDEAFINNQATGVVTGAEIDEWNTVTRATNVNGNRSLIITDNSVVTGTTVANVGFEYDNDFLIIEGRLGYSLTDEDYPDSRQLITTSAGIAHGFSIENDFKLPEYIWAKANYQGELLEPHQSGETSHDSNQDIYGNVTDGTYWYYSPESAHNLATNIYHHDRSKKDQTYSAQLDVEYLLSSEHFTSLMFGAMYTNQATERYSENNGLSFYTNLVELQNKIWLDDGSLAGSSPIDNFMSNAQGSNTPYQSLVTNWVFGDFEQINTKMLEIYNESEQARIADLNIGKSEAEKIEYISTVDINNLPWLIDLRQSYTVDQEFAAIYAQANLDTLDGRLLGDFGLRLVQTKIDATGYGGGAVLDFRCVSDNNYIPSDCANLFDNREGSNEYTTLLPTLNLKYLLGEDTVTRIAIGRAMSRPYLHQLAPYRRESTNQNQPQQATVYEGNPELDAQTAWQADIAYEWYFDKAALLSVGVFYKNIDTFIYTRTDVINEPLSDASNTPYDYLDNDGVTQYYNPYFLVQPVNGSGAEILGVEAAYSHPLTFLPGDLSGLGITFNYTYADSKAKYQGANTAGETITIDTSFISQSKHTTNAAVYWEKYGHSIRLSYNHRSDSLSNPLTSTKDMLWNDAYGQFDFAARYRINKALTVGIQGTNLTDESTYRYHTSVEDGSPVDNDVYENRLAINMITGRTIRFTMSGTF
ncbi:TonB-dependent receptor [Paraglaciecola sp. L3A3]|uniref:TonB-dependent receptor n=1 Tax=Paraglaciecola sp. L3A3 TaxID=2686358 RepID=UPI00131DA110|nr:TonB-dependent receptor [Paraglaciecola sp. L3A3]